MKTQAQDKATFAEVFGSIKFAGKTSTTSSRPWPKRGFAVSQSTHMGGTSSEESKSVRSSN
ncbi:hypothetical protein EYC98_15730 [Halieaceae bacterium IMCC14734]|uniref:Uncharacterized protein n=1 Tax=Candidatus Litorirhabdus singularis TaxID=2518993 RepID=A0ABT3TJ20_9GAMM|nr:hypothetical protein [Candidatus Litorirhabdus singularis]MCX2982313.1 hypothetical protein [Candidatus Litorirhabdus singularis]